MKFLTWNIQSGGGRRIGSLCREVIDAKADYITLTEFRSKNEVRFREIFWNAGYTDIFTTKPEGNENGLFIASKKQLITVNDYVGHDSSRWLSVLIPELDLRILNVHIPGATDHKKLGKDGYGILGDERKKQFWTKVVDYCEQHQNKKVVILGDFNTGLKQDAEGTPFKFPEFIERLKSIGYADTWRTLNPEGREFTWYTQRNGGDFNGFRLDYVFVSSALRQHILGASHDNNVRKSKLSDHAIVIAEIDVGSV